MQGSNALSYCGHDLSYSDNDNSPLRRRIFRRGFIVPSYSCIGTQNIIVVSRCDVVVNRDWRGISTQR